MNAPASALSLLLLLSQIEPPEDLPDLDDLDLFPCHHVCDIQLSRIERHREIISQLELIHGWSSGQYRRWQMDLDRDERYWKLLMAAWSNPFGFSDRWRRCRLADLQQHVGESNYWQGWHPALLPEVKERDQPFRRPAVRMSVAGTNGAQ